MSKKLYPGHTLIPVLFLATVLGLAALYVPQAHAAAPMALPPSADADVYAYTYRNWSNSNVGRNSTLTAGYNPTGGERRIFMRFDMGNIPPVTSAELRLHHYHTGGDNSLQLGVYRVIEPWKEGTGVYHSGQVEPDAAPGELSWANQPEFDPTPVAVFSMPGAPGGFVNVDITDLVKEWRSGKANYGLVIRPLVPLTSTPGESQYGFVSREHENAGQRPVLLINGGGETPPGVTSSSLRSIKLFDPVPRQNSSAFRQNVFKQLSIATTSWDSTPYHMQAVFSAELIVEPGEKVFLSADPNQPKPVTVDNFLLFEVEFKGFVSRFIVGQTEPVFFDGTPVPQIVPSVQSVPADRDLSGLFPRGKPFRLTVSALDYGGIAELSAVYLLLQ